MTGTKPITSYYVLVFLLLTTLLERTSSLGSTSSTTTISSLSVHVTRALGQVLSTKCNGQPSSAYWGVVAIAATPGSTPSIPSPADPTILDQVYVMYRGNVAAPSSSATGCVYSHLLDRRTLEPILQGQRVPNIGSLQSFLDRSAGYYSAATISYEVFFPTNFNFVKGGKLHGIRGGNGLSTTSCSGGASDDNCFSARVVWTEGGGVGVYWYAGPPAMRRTCDANKSLLMGRCTDESYTFGILLGNTTMKFRKGAWNRVSIEIRFPSAGDTTSARLRLTLNNIVVAANVFTARPGLKVREFLWSTFFGGADPAIYFTRVNQSARFRGLQYTLGN